ncbi:TPA: patatin-like phospholipase family protein [Aeromonas hydrophila]|uniref:patatin-like phospholipase family protein n=1 Tax=Aeromonas hydrophila TaxID=644 RepID=UPI000C344427|nr:patatin family protein [Aeromonas hydrophila]PKD22953.1 alpha/beta fold family hydrolase [Aeromonas hydrophila]WRK92518.1 patatin family protein [Aeromonas hydrophila]HAT2713273.1 patatin family protein [Aeromonas hydrophila]
MSRRQTALVVEGGAMRGIFAAGVLDAFLAKGRTAFDHCIGVSAGAVNLAAFLAGQQGRNYNVITDYSCRPEFINLAKFLRGGHWLDLDWLWAITIRECRLDLARFTANPVPLTVVTTRVADGQAAYLKANAAELEQQIKASCSVPLVYRDFVRIDGEAMTDGGVADSIPVRHAYEQGARDITVVLSRPLGYRKRAPRLPALHRYLLRETPALARASLSRHQSYNDAIDFIRQPPADCRIRVIVPPAGFRVGRMTTDKGRLEQGYQMGWQAALDYLGSA